MIKRGKMIDLIVYYSTSTNNTHAFVEKLGLNSIRIPKRLSDPMPIVDKPYCLIVPTYKGGKDVTGTEESSVPKQVHKFLQEEKNRELAKLVIAGGNINFGEYYCIAGKEIQEKYGIPYKYRFELRGNEQDVRIIQENLKVF